MRAGLFGGTFNPIHKGHLMAAQRALEHCCLDRLYLIPCRVPPHKFPAYLAPATDRMQMIRLALPADPRYLLSDVEIRRRGPSYTIDTVEHFCSQIIPAADLFLIMGMDAFLEIHTWKHQRRLLAMVRPVVVTRRVDDRMQSDTDRLDAYIRSRLSADYHYIDAQTCWNRTDKNRIHLLPTPPLGVSSSQVRKRIQAGKSIAGLVPVAVNAYIEQKELYR